MNVIFHRIGKGVGKMPRLPARSSHADPIADKVKSSHPDTTKLRPSRSRAIAVATTLIVAGLQPGLPAWADSPAAAITETQATIKRLGFGLSQITLPARAARRLDIKTDQIREDASGRKETPYASIIYDLDGDAWVYTVTAPLTFVRSGVVVELIDREHAYLREGPPAGTQVVTVGVPELYGTEVGVNGE